MYCMYKCGMAIAILFALYVLASNACHGQDYPFRNTTLSFEDRVKVSRYVYGSHSHG